MSWKLKSARKSAAVEAASNELQATVSGIILDVEKRGDAALRDFSVKFDGLDRKSYRLGEDEIKTCLDSVNAQQREDIEFASEQVRVFAEHQLSTMLPLEVETRPGVVLGHKHLPIGNVGCYVPGGKYPLLASAHMSVLISKVAC